jgi:hypothetical protein
MSKNLRDHAKDQGIALSRQDATGMLFLLERNGVNLQYAGKQADELAAIYADAVARRCATSQWQLSHDELLLLRDWLGAPAESGQPLPA